MKAKIINTALYQFDFLFLTDCTLPEAQTYVRRSKMFKEELDLGEPKANVQGRTWRTEKAIAVWVPARTRFSTIVHELMHVIFFVLHTRGLELSESSEEAYTYLMNHVFEQVIYDKKGWKTIERKRFR